MPKKIAKNEAVAIQSEPQREVDLVGNGNIPLFYANNASLKATFWDLRIEWGVILDKDGGKTSVQPAAATVMTWAHAKVLTGLIATLIENYEKQFGEITLPKRNTTIDTK